MGRKRRNFLHLDPLPGGGHRLHGYVFGKQIRKQGQNLPVLMALKGELEGQIAARGEADARARSQWSAADQRDAEAAKILAGSYSLVQCVQTAIPLLTAGQGKMAADALTDWIAFLKASHRVKRTRDKNNLRIKAFLAASGAGTLSDITPDKVEAWVLRENVKPGTQATDGQVLKAFLNFCLRKRWIKQSPFEISVKDLASHVSFASARVLSPDQCLALVRASESEYDGIMRPYVLLALFCFMRHSEALAVKPEHIKKDQAPPIISLFPVKRGTPKYREVEIPGNIVEAVQAPVFYSKEKWDAVREKAGLLEREDRQKRGGNRKHLASAWQPNILRHTGISYFYQRTKNITEVCRQAGNSSAVAFRHYLSLPAQGDSYRFYSISPAPTETAEKAPPGLA